MDILLCVDASRQSMLEKVYDTGAHRLLFHDDLDDIADIFEDAKGNFDVLVLTYTGDMAAILAVIDQVKLLNPLLQILVLYEELDTTETVQLIKSGASNVLGIEADADRMKQTIEQLGSDTALLQKSIKGPSDKDEISITDRLDLFARVKSKLEAEGEVVTRAVIEKFFPIDERNTISFDAIFDRHMAENPTPEPRGLSRILIIEDETDMLRTLEMLFTRHHFDVMTAASGHDGLEAFTSAGTFDLVLLDIGLPDITGDKLVSGILQQDPKQKILMLTAYKDKELVVTTIGDGAAGYLTKPFEHKDLIKKAEALIQRKHFESKVRDIWRASIEKEFGLV